MATNYVSDTKAGKQISAYVILKGSKEIAVVRFHHGNGRTLVNIFHNDGNTEFQSGSARGGGYDLATAALSGLKIDGYTLFDHCESKLAKPKAGGWVNGFKPPRGYTLANYNNRSGLWNDCYRDAGLTYLKALGYRVIQAI